MDDLALVGRELGGRHAPGLGRGLDEHDPGGGAGLAEAQVVVRRGAAAARELGADVAAQTRLLDHDGGEIGIELLGHDHGQGSLHALARLGILREDGDDVLRGDLDERIRRELPGRAVEHSARLGECRAGQGVADDEAAAREGGDAEEFAAGEIREL